ncbi:MAG: ISNCY family transposase [Deltaproteobacteria bacterium]|nr:ISNCY family transposase [Deltaproteobacteria bacterium]
MRKFTRKDLDEMDIPEIELDPKSRDDIPQLLKGLQYIFLTPFLREEVFKILDEMFPESIDRNNGRPGMDMWSIFVMGVLRLNLNWDYDRLHEMVNNHGIVRQLLGHGLDDDGEKYGLQNIKDNVVLLTTEILDEINQVVVKAGHEVVKKSEEEQKLDNKAVDKEKLRGRCDSFPVETNVHYPTDTSLLFDAIRVVIKLLMQLCLLCGLSEWEAGNRKIKQVKKLLRKIQNLKHSRSKDEKKQEARKKLIIEAHQEYLNGVAGLLDQVDKTLQTICIKFPWAKPNLLKIEKFIDHAKRQTNQIERRVIKGETISHEEKVFSIFEGHTEWISKGKVGVEVELGLNVCILEDRHGFILHHHVMQKQTDSQVAVPMIEEAQARFPNLAICSFDKGFHSPENQEKLADLLELTVLPKKGNLSKKEQKRENSEKFIDARRQHAAVESAINALEHHGLDRCPDHGLEGFKRYAALAVVARNIQILGVYLRRQETNESARQYQEVA